MLDILFILACISLGMALGWFGRAHRPLLTLADRTSLYAVYALLFILGVRLGGDEALLRMLPVLGARAFCIAFLCTAGSVLCISLAGRLIPRSPLPSGTGSGQPSSLSPLSGSLRILGCFGAGVALSVISLTPGWMRDSALATYALYLLVFAVGIGLGADLKAFRILRDLHVKILAVPLLVVAGTALGAAAAAPLLPGLGLADTLCVGAGLGYYSLSSILIENAGDPILASTALLANILRELLAILGAPFLARYCGRLSTVGASGATAMDTTLPIIARFSGERAAVVAVFSGMTLTLLVPFLVTALLQWKQ